MKHRHFLVEKQGLWKAKSDNLGLASIVGMTMWTILILLILSGCVTRAQIDAVMFKHERIPEDICNREPQLRKLGVIRIFNCTPELVQAGICAPNQEKVRERISYCKPQIERYLGIRDDDLERILKEAGIKD